MMNKHSAIFILLIFLCLIVRVINFIGIGTNDDICYIDSARILASGKSPFTSQIGFRSGMVVPLAILYRTFGLNEIAFAAYPLVCSLLTCTFIYLSALFLWGIVPAVCAALLWIAFPLQIVFDTQLSPSNQHATCVAASLFCYAIAAKQLFLSKWSRIGLLVLCGVFLGCAWLVNEIFVTFILIILPFIIIVRPKPGALLWITVGFVLVFFLELLVIKIVTGSWFMRFVCILNTEQVITSNKEPSYLPRTLFKVFGANPFYEEGHFGIIWYLFIIATIATFFLKDKLPLALSLGCWLWLGYLQWGIQSPEGTPIARYIRYFSMIVPLQCLVLGFVTWRFLGCTVKVKPVIIILFIAFIFNLSWLGIKAVDAVRIHTEDFREISRILLKQNLKDEEVIYTDFLSGDYIEIYTGGRFNIMRPKLRQENIFAQMPEPQNGILVKDGSRAVMELTEYRSTMPGWYLSPPEHWQLIATIKSANRDVYETFDPQIYKILPKNMTGDQQ